MLHPVKRRLVRWYWKYWSDRGRDDILIFVRVVRAVTPYWHLPVDLSFLHEKVVVWWWQAESEGGKIRRYWSYHGHQSVSHPASQLGSNPNHIFYSYFASGKAWTRAFCKFFCYWHWPRKSESIVFPIRKIMNTTLGVLWLWIIEMIVALDSNFDSVP